MTMVTAKIQQP